MRTISKNILLRLTAQANEADLYNDIKTADNLTKQIEKYATEDKVRDDDDKYKYSKEELAEDLEKTFWEAAIRIFDYYEATPDAKEIQEIIESQVNHFLGTIENMIPKDIGEHEPEVPGEEKSDVHEVSEKAFDAGDDDEEYIEEDEDDEKEEEKE